MLTFVIGVLAALLWLGTVMGLYLLVKSSPRHPFQTIREFRLARRRLATPSGPIVEVVTPEPPQVEEHNPVFVEEQSPPEPEASNGAQSAEPKHSGGAVERYKAQVEWLEPQREPAVIEIPDIEEEVEEDLSVSPEVEEEADLEKEPQAAASRVAVVLVDDEGKPQL